MASACQICGAVFEVAEEYYSHQSDEHPPAPPAVEEKYPSLAGVDPTVPELMSRLDEAFNDLFQWRRTIEERLAVIETKLTPPTTESTGA